MRPPSMECTVLSALTLTLATGCAASGAPAARANRIVAPVTYAGRLPCADCPGIQLTVTLFPDSTFRRVWPGAICEARMPGATPENTYWKLLELGGPVAHRPARVARGARRDTHLADHRRPAPNLPSTRPDAA